MKKKKPRCQVSDLLVNSISKSESKTNYKQILLTVTYVKRKKFLIEYENIGIHPLPIKTKVKS